MSTSVKDLKKRARELGVDPVAGMEKAELECLVADAEEQAQAKRTKASIGHPVGWWQVDPRSLRGLATVEIGEVDSMGVGLDFAGACIGMEPRKAPGIVDVKLDRLCVVTDDGKNDIELPGDMLLFRGTQIAFIGSTEPDESGGGFTVAAIKSLVERELLKSAKDFDRVERFEEEGGLTFDGIHLDERFGGFYDVMCDGEA